MKKAKKLVLGILAVILVVALSGCMRVHIDVVWNKDNSATLATSVGISNSVLTMMNVSASEIQKQIRESMNEDGEDYSFKDFKDSEYTGVTATIKIDDITKSSAQSIDPIKFKYSEEGKKKVYTVEGIFSGSEAFAGKSAFEESGISIADVDMKLSIVMPGNITSHNADEKDGSKLIWDLTSSSITSVKATSEISGGLFSGLFGGGSGGKFMLVLILGLVVLAAVVVVIILLSRKKKAPQPQQNADYTPYPAQQAQYPQYPVATAPQPAQPAYDYTAQQMLHTQYPQYPAAGIPAAPPAYDYSAQQAPPAQYPQPPAAETPATPVYEYAAPEQPPAEVPPAYNYTATAKAFCTNCGAEVTGMKFCGSCGAMV